MDEPFFSTDSLKIFNADCTIFRSIPDESVDLIVTSPPYNVEIDYNTYDDTSSYKGYLDFNSAWMKRCFNLAKPDGRFCLNIPLDKNKGGQQSIYADLTSIAKEVGWKYQFTIVWNEQNISRRTAWGSYLSASAPYVIAPVEMIVVFYKEVWKKANPGTSDILPEEFKTWTNGMWTFNGETKRKSIGHPAPFPIELPYRCIKLFSYVGDTVLDPFLGSGTTLIASIENKRKGIGVEMDAHYCELAKNRLINGGYINQFNF